MNTKTLFQYYGVAPVSEAPEKASIAEPVFVARPERGEIDFDALRVSVMARLSKARAYLAR